MKSKNHGNNSKNGTSEKQPKVLLNVMNKFLSTLLGIGLLYQIGCATLNKPAKDISFADEQKIISSENFPSKAKKQSTAKEAAIIVSEAIPAIYATILIHETGHALAAESLGYGIKSFDPWPELTENGGILFASYKHEKISNKSHRIAITASGVLASRLSSEGIDGILNHTNPPKRLQQFGGIAYLAARLDLPFYASRSTIKYLVGPDRFVDETDDICNISHYITNNKIARNGIHFGILAMALLDLALDYDEIKTNFYRALNKESPQKNHNKISMDLEINSNYIGAGIEGKF